MKVEEPSLTFGIEEEYHLVDLQSRNLSPAPAALLAECERVLGQQFSPEFLRSQIEVGTKVCRSFPEARRELARLRRSVIQLSGQFGLAPIAAGTHPFALKSGHEMSTTERYQVVAHDLAGVGRRMSISGMHVHAAIENANLRIDLMNQIRYFLPHLLMLSTSSPFWQGEDTGMKSYRLAVSDEGPRKGLPNRFADFNEYESTIDVLVRTGVIEDGSKVWWDVRPSSKFPTLEMRITDVTPLIEDTLTIAAVYLSLLRMLWRLGSENISWRHYPVFLIDENRWRARRYGVDGSLIDFAKGQLVPFRTLVEELLERTAEDAEALGCSAEVQRARDIAATGTSADRQVETFHARLTAGHSREDALRGVVDQLLAETASGLDPVAQRVEYAVEP